MGRSMARRYGGWLATLSILLLVVWCPALLRASSHPPTSPYLDQCTPTIEFSEYDRNEAVSITDTGTAYRVTAGGMTFLVSKQSFDLQVREGSQELARSLGASIEFNGQRLTVGPPATATAGSNWVELRGWFSADHNLWYVARFRFWPDLPFVHLAFSITDRHDDHPTEAHWDSLWQNRVLQNFRITLTTGDTLAEKVIVQDNAFSGGEPNVSPKIEEHAATNEVHWRQIRRDDGVVELIHDYDNSGGTYLKIFPYRSGHYSLRLKQTPLLYPYPAASEVQVAVHHAAGTTNLVVDQAQPTNELGDYDLDANSYVQITATGVSGDRVVFEELELTDGTTISIRPYRVPDNVLNSGRYGLVVKDFSKRFPIEASSGGNLLQITGIRQATRFVGGVGFTFDLGFNFDAATLSSCNLVKLLEQPPQPSLPPWLSQLDAMLAIDSRYRELVEMSAAIIHGNDEASGNYGWMNWGDYQIGNSYFTSGEPTEDWGALQYDLGYGLLMAWMHTRDPYLWNRARAAIRSSMDIQIAKFEPYHQKRSGGGIRKGACTSNFHWCQENIPEFNYHARSLLLYSSLTGETWPRDIAHMVLDNSAYMAYTRTQWAVEHERVAAWALRNFVYGARLFPEGTVYNSTPEVGYSTMVQGTSYQDLLQILVSALVTEIESLGQMPGMQPVWAGQIVEGMIMAYESGLLPESLRTRLLEAIKSCVSAFVSQHLRGDSVNGYEMLYYKPNSWTSAMAYGYFWVNSMVWVSRHTDLDVMDTFRDLYAWLYEMHRSSSYKTTRIWSGVMAYPSYASHYGGGPGDVNGSGQTNLRDIVSVLHILLDDSRETVAPGADVSGNQKIDQPEAIYILQQVGSP